ncbi:alpha-L-arabinofuranosidase C-terminal domain-containing protein, partial [Bacteroides heparinolyticus]|uniref:alpha-L-arabinofuranosidase C-terminal domain-containing protein n=1 Tax=Prevotella heparinolytica TaxID=28113 RepID=UPI0035A087D1
ITVKAEAGKKISDHLIGIFFEDINYAADGGLYAELIQNRDFEYAPADRGNDRNWNSTHSWALADAGYATLNVETLSPLHPNNPHYAVLEVRSAPGAGLVNSGFDGIAVKEGARYDFSLFGKVLEGKGGKVVVKLLDTNGAVIGQSSVTISSKDWKQQKTVVTATADVPVASLAIYPQVAGKYALDMISLFPQETFKGRKNGLRVDLAQTLADLHPRFIRFPGGCVAHGDGVDNIYDWKGSIGPLESRKPLRNLWGYHQTRGLGYFEYFQYCEDIGAEPLPVLAAGVPCQNSGTCAHHSTDELTCMGQQGGIPMEEMDKYIQDVLDLIEYANGDARRTKWGKMRAEAGHPKPFNLKFIGIGNEDMITDVFEERFTLIYNAVREKHPEITVIGTVGPFYEGTDYEEGWELATHLGVPMVDEHYYVEPGWLIHNQDYYDRYDRNKPKVYLGEYASHVSGRHNNIETALTEALYLTSVERNGDVVSMTSYAPLLAKEGHTQWNPDLIYFNNTEVKPTVSYYVQQMYGQHSGSEYLPSVVSLDNQPDAVRKRVGVSVVKDKARGDYIVKLVNLLPVKVASRIRLEGVSLVDPSATKTLLTGEPQSKDAKPVTSPFEIGGEEFSYEMPPYSFTVIRIGQGEKK